MMEEYGYEFCQESEAEEWYDFHVNSWKRMDMAGYHCDNKLYRREIANSKDAYTPTRWEDLPREQQKSHYWAAKPKDPDDILDGWAYEIVYVYFDGKWSVYRPGIKKREPLDNFRFLFMLNLPEIS